MNRHPWTAFCLLALLGLLASGPASAGDEPVDLEMVNRIRAEGFHRSQVLKTLRHLTDEIGPRLTGSPGMAQANVWTRDQLEEWGLVNAHLNPWGPFGRGWSFSRREPLPQKPPERPKKKDDDEEES